MRTSTRLSTGISLTLSLLFGSLQAEAVPSASAQGVNSSVQLSYHWHLHQPIYWPEKLPGTDRVQFASESYDIKTRGQGFYPGSTVPHPQNNLATGDIGSYDPIFTNADRVQVYQSGGRDSIAHLFGFPDAGASISYSGSLMDNVWSWEKDYRMGYSPNWNQGYSEARRWVTSGGKPRADLVGFTYHHSLAPLLPKSVLRKELRLFKQAWGRSWGGRPDGSDHSHGFFPPELAFSETMIPVLLDEGYQWSFIANGHLARSCSNYLDQNIAPNHATSTWNTNPPNASDMVNPPVAANRWWSGSIDGRGAKVPAPFAYQPHWARYVDPETGKESRMVVVPADEVLGYINGYSMMGTELVDRNIAPFNDPRRPSIVVMAHDGDNAFGGGYSYYHESVPHLASEAEQKGYRMTTIEQYLASFPVPSSDLVHVEDGGWVNPEGDWGDPQFVKWLYPPARSPRDPGFNPKDPRTFIDIENGFSSSWRSWAVITAGANVCETAEQIGGAGDSRVDRAWHFYLAGLDSGFMYYGDSLDDEVKQSLALNQALPYARQVIEKGERDLTPPTIFRPQRWPYNPGGIGWGVTTRYQDVGTNGKPPFDSDFHVWSLVYDVSGLSSVTVKVRPSLTGATAPGLGQNTDHFTYRGGPSVGQWVSFPMNRRAIDVNFAGDPPNPNLNYFIKPEAIADHYRARITGYREVLLDYYIEAVDRKGNVARSDIFHVWVGGKKS
jgi:hypothetical protein